MLQLRSWNAQIAILITDENPEEYKVIVCYLIDHIIESKPVIEAGQTIAYKSWILQFQDEGDETFLIYEVNATGSDFIPGVETAVRVVSDQSAECEKLGVSAIFPSFNQMVVISKGVYDGLPLQGVRYPSPPHMSGWWLTTDEYDGNIKSLSTEHYFHVAFKRPQILKYLSLPFGFRFYVGPNGEEDIWYDKAAISLT